jgi:hypothetical protein
MAELAELAELAYTNHNNKRFQSWEFCSQSMKEDLDYIIKIFNFDSIEHDIIKKNEYRNYLMIITNNCNQYIEQKFKINKIKLNQQIEYEKGEKQRYRVSKTIKTFGDIIINDEKVLNIKFDANYETYEDFFSNKNLLNDNYDNTIFKISGKNLTHVIYVKVTKKDDDSSYNIIDIETDNILNNKLFKFEIKYNYGDEEITYTYPFTSIAIINDNEKAEQYNKEHYQPGGGILSKNKGKKWVYKSTKQKISVIIDKKPRDRTVYKNAKGILYIRCNNEYKLLKKYKLAKK